MRISDWSSDVCSSDLQKFGDRDERPRVLVRRRRVHQHRPPLAVDDAEIAAKGRIARERQNLGIAPAMRGKKGGRMGGRNHRSGHRASQAAGTSAVKTRASPVPEILSSRSEEHTSELQSLMRTSYAALC